jgi:hypothetical protein
MPANCDGPDQGPATFIEGDSRMKRAVSIAAALVLAGGTLSGTVFAQQGGIFARSGYNGTKPAVIPAGLSKATPVATAKAIPGRSKPAQHMEELPKPSRGPNNGQMMGVPMEQYHGDGGYYPSDGYVGEGFGGYGHGGGSCGPECYSGDCYGCDDCCSTDYGYNSPSWWDCFDCCGLVGTKGNQPRWYFVGDYLYVRANFSEAVAYLEHNDDSTPLEFHDTFHELNFRHESSYRLGCCDEQLRFMYTRMTSSASGRTTDPNAIGPFETSPGPGGILEYYGNVDSHSWDLEYAKTIPLGGSCASQCGDCCGCDPCGCGDACCPPPCPAWDITWSGGLRFANVEWQRRYDSFNFQTESGRDARTTMDFEGGGPRFGLEGRRYFGERNWCSLYLRGDISLLLGNLQFNTNRVSFDDTPPDVVETLSSHNRNIIPVTEIEAGATVQLTKWSRFSTGYLFGAWHDLGFRDQFDFATFLETNYDDANILGWDGYFARLELCY